MKKLSYPVICAVIILLLVVPAREACSQKLELSGFLIDTHGDSLVARFSIEIDDMEKIKAALDNGSKLALICDVRLLKSRTLLWDQALARQEIEIGLEKDLLSKEYDIVFPDQKKSLVNFERNDFLDQFGDMQARLLPLDSMEPDRNYAVRIQVRLISRGVPNWIKRTLFFWSWDLAESIRYEMEFSL
jgi:hypothetical protein